MLKILSRIKSKKRGFTLIELIVVIAILGILAAILVPSMLGIVSDSKTKVNRSNARAIYSVAQSAYVSLATEGTPPTPGDLTKADTSTFMTKVKNSLDADMATAAYTIKVTTNGVESVTYEGVTYPESASASTST